MKCNNCGAEVPEGRTTCPNCAADPLAPKKEKQLGIYRESIKAVRRLCIFEWITFFFIEVVYIGGLFLIWSYESKDLFALGERDVSYSFLPWIIMTIAFAGWVAAMVYVYNSMKYYQGDFHRIIRLRIRLDVMLFVPLLSFSTTSLVIWIILFLVFLGIPILVLFAMFYHHIFQVISAFTKELSADISQRSNQLSAIYPVLIVVLGLMTPFFLMMVSTEEGYVFLLAIPTFVQLLFLLGLPLFMLRVYRLCRSTMVSYKTECFGKRDELS